MKYNDIDLKIISSLEKEKKRFIQSEDKRTPLFFCSANNDNLFCIITGPFECEAMQIIGEFEHDLSIDKLFKTYVVVGNKVLEIEKILLDHLIKKNFILEANEQEQLKSIYNQFLSNDFDYYFQNYIDYCQNLRNNKRKKIKLY